MDLILNAIEAIESREDHASFSYRKVANQFGVDRTTVLRHYQGIQGSNEEMGKAQQLLSPQQELELVQYIERRTMQGLLPTREIVQNLGSAVAKLEVLQSWVTQFLHRHADKLTTKWSTGINCDQHKADSGNKYKLYLDLLHGKMQEYGIDKRNKYNMNEKGFFVGCTTCSKRVFSKASLAQKQRTTALQNDNRRWVMCIACICASGDALPPALVYQSIAGIQSSWVDNFVAKQHKIFVSHSPSRWSNNEIELA
jgi:transposase